MIRPTFVYASQGAELMVFALDAETGSLTELQTVSMPASVQYACFTKAGDRIYIALSQSAPMARVKADINLIRVHDIGPDGRLSDPVQTVTLDNRPLSIVLDRQARHLLLAYNDPSEVSVHGLDEGGLIGDRLPQDDLCLGMTVHQVEVSPEGGMVLVPACAHDATGDVPGEVTLLRYDDGRLARAGTLRHLPDRAYTWIGRKYGAYGFAARHVAFHPSGRWMYLCVERQSEVWQYSWDNDGADPQLVSITSALQDAADGPSMQLASAIRLHPDGRHLYVSNRARETHDADGTEVFVGGTNDVTVMTIDRETGVPRVASHHDTGGIYPRCFGLDAGQGVLIAANERAGFIRDGGAVHRVVPGLVIFRIAADGSLKELSRLNFADNGEAAFWIDTLRPAHFA